MLGLRHAVFVDANVLYSGIQRDWLGLLHRNTDAFEVFWSEDVLAETMYHLRKRHPDWDGGQISRVHDRLTSTFEDGRVADFPIDPGFAGRDPDDAHVHSAALACDADILLTNNFTDFPSDGLAYETYHPDDFFVLIDDSTPEIVGEVTQSQVSY